MPNSNSIKNGFDKMKQSAFHLNLIKLIEKTLVKKKLLKRQQFIL